MEYTYGEYISEADSEFIMECLACITEEDVRNSSDYKVFKALVTACESRNLPTLDFESDIYLRIWTHSKAKAAERSW